nr:MAG TPA: Protein of unknown function (DUF1642) [Caudoviricetes sp.]
MNVQRLIEKYEKLEGVWDAEGAESARKIFLMDLKQLDEPQPVKVPQFVADWYEENKDDFELNLWVFLTEFDEENIDMSERFGLWLGDEDNNPIQTLVNMHQFGYEVEEEKRYFVKLKAVDQYLVSVKDEDFLGFLQSRLRSKFTRKQLEDADFGWVFSCEGIEIEEVE